MKRDNLGNAIISLIFSEFRRIRKWGIRSYFYAIQILGGLAAFALEFAPIIIKATTEGVKFIRLKLLLHDPIAELVFASGIIGFGYLIAVFLYRFKRVNKIWYGRLEISFGGVVFLLCFVKDSEVHIDTGMNYLGIISALYVMTRGYTNLKEGQEKRANAFTKNHQL